MRTSNDFFNQPYTLEDLEPLTPRPTVPLIPGEITTKQTLPPIPTVHSPTFTPTPILSPTSPPIHQTSALEQIQVAIQKEVGELKQNKPNLDQLIQNALKQKIQLEQNNKQKIVTIKKRPPPQAIKPTPPSPTPIHIPKVTPKPIKVSSPPVVNTVVGTKPFQQPQRSLWWPSQQEVIVQKLKQNDFAKPTTTKTPSTFVPQTIPEQAPARINPSQLPHNVTIATKSSTLGNKVAVVKTAFHVSGNILSYFLFSISEESDPYDDSTRQKIIYSIKFAAYSTTLFGIFEIMRNIGSGVNLNSAFEIFSIFLISAILFFFGENLSMLFKPSNPYQIHEVV